VKSFLAHHPLRGLERSARKTFAAARRVAQGNRVGGGIESDLVRTGNRPGPVRAGIDRSRVSRLFHLLDQLQ